jgi:hypothetical protein
MSKSNKAAKAATLAQAEEAHAKAAPSRQDAILKALEAAQAADDAQAAQAAKRAEAKAAKAEAKPRGPSMIDEALELIRAAGRDLGTKALIAGLRALRPHLGHEAKGAIEARRTAEAARERGDEEAAQAADERASKAQAAQAEATIAATLHTAAKHGKIAKPAKGLWAAPRAEAA